MVSEKMGKKKSSWEEILPKILYEDRYLQIQKEFRKIAFEEFTRLNSRKLLEKETQNRIVS